MYIEYGVDIEFRGNIYGVGVLFKVGVLLSVAYSTEARRNSVIIAFKGTIQYDLILIIGSV